MLYVLLYGRYPFPGPEGPELMAQITACVWAMPNGISAQCQVLFIKSLYCYALSSGCFLARLLLDISPPCQDLLSRLLQKDPGQRLSMDEIKQHAWFLEGLPPNALDQQGGEIAGEKDNGQYQLPRRLKCFFLPCESE